MQPKQLDVKFEKQKDRPDPFGACEVLARSHYENFTILSRLVPRKLRPHFSAVYSYFRCTDDIGDEVPGDRLLLLDQWERELHEAFDGKAKRFPFTALTKTLQLYNLDREYFLRPIEASRRDQRIKRYATYKELVEYSTYSVTPFGRLLLQIVDCRGDDFYRLSDATCIAHQLVNFWQDITVDYNKGRLYIPEEDLAKFGISEDDVAERNFTPKFRDLMIFECSRVRNLFAEGWELIHLLPLRWRYPCGLVTYSGIRLLNKIEGMGFDVLSQRPVLAKRDRAKIALRAGFKSVFSWNSLETVPEVPAWP